MKIKDPLGKLSLAALVLIAAHLADDYVHGFDRHVLDNPYGLLALVVWACGLFVLRERMIGRIILLIGGLLAVVAAAIHLRGGYPPSFAASDGAFRFIWTLYALGTTGAVAAILAAVELFGRRRETSPHGD